MKIYNQDKTQELDKNTLDFELGYLVNDKHFITHHAAIPFRRGRTAQEIAAELEAAGVVIEESFLGLFRVVEENENGRLTAPILDEPDTSARDAYDEYEDIQVYVPYTFEELQEHKLTNLRMQREPLLVAFDKWEKAVLRGREQDDYVIMYWYQNLLDLKDTAFSIIPERIKYYL